MVLIPAPWALSNSVLSHLNCPHITVIGRALVHRTVKVHRRTNSATLYFFSVSSFLLLATCRHPGRTLGVYYLHQVCSLQSLCLSNWQTGAKSDSDDFEAGPHEHQYLKEYPSWSLWECSRPLLTSSADALNWAQMHQSSFDWNFLI